MPHDTALHPSTWIFNAAVIQVIFETELYEMIEVFVLWIYECWQKCVTAEDTCVQGFSCAIVYEAVILESLKLPFIVLFTVTPLGANYGTEIITLQSSQV